MSVAHLVDGSLYVCRAWFSQAPDVTDADGAPAHAAHGFLRDLTVVDVCLGGDFAGDDDESGRYQRLACDAAFWVFRQDGVED